MNKKFLSAILFGALMIGSVGTFTSCKDYDDDIESLDKKSSDLSSQLTALQTALDAAKADAAAAKSTADAAKEAAATAKAEAIQAAIDKVNELMKNAPTAEAVADLASKISAIETGLNKLVGADDVKTAMEQLKIQLDALKGYKTLIDANSSEIGKINNAIAAINETLNAADKSIKAVEKSLADISAQIAAINEDLVTILGKELRSIVFYPDLYTDGIESTEYPFALDVYLDSKALSAASAGKVDDGTTPYSIPAKQVVSYSPTTATWEFNPTMTAWYHMNPSSAVIDSKDQLSFVSRDIESITRAAGNESVATPAVQGFDIKTKPGMLGVQYTAIGKKISADKDLVSAMALQVDIKKAEKDTTITSDYAVLYPAKITAEAIAYSQKDIKAVDCVNTDFDQVYETAQAAIEHAPTLKVEYNGALELKDYLAIHYNRSNAALGLTDTKTAGEHKVWAYGEEATYNLEYKYSLVEYTVGTANTQVHKYGNVNESTGHFEPRYVDSNGNSIASDGTTGISAVGKKPVVRVEVIDKTTKKVVLGGFVKILIAKTVNPIVADPFDMGQAAYICNFTTKKLTWAQMSNQLLELAAVASKAEFEKQYTLDRTYASNVPGWDGYTNDYYANVYVKEDDEFVRMDELTKYGKSNFYYGYLEEYGNIQGVANDEIHWGLDLAQRNNILAANDNHQVTVYLRYKPTADLNEEGGLPSIYVPLTLQVVKPQANIEKKIAEYWYSDNNTDAFNKETSTYQRLNVPYPKDNGNSLNYIVDLDNAFEVNSLLHFNAIKFDLTNNTNDLFKGNWANENGDYIQYIYYFDEPIVPAAARELTINGAKFKLQSRSNGGTQNVLVVNGVDVATISQNYLPLVQSNGELTYSNNTTSKLFLNAISHDKKYKNSESNYAKIGIKAFNNCDIVLGNWKMNARFLRPIDADPVSGKQFTDAEANGSVVKIADLLSFRDWRDVYFVTSDYKNVWLFAYYGVQGVDVKISEITTDMNGHDISKDKLSGVTTQVNFSQVGNKTFNLSAYNAASSGTVATYNAIVAALGQIKYENNGNNVKEFNVRIPIDVTYDWGTIRSYVDCKVINTMGN
nr:hypothetical protein [Bacteroides intestinalis]